MNIDRDQLEQDKARLWQLFEEQSAASSADAIDALREQFFDIRQAYGDLIRSEGLSADSYEYIEFCFLYLSSYIVSEPGRNYINPDDEILGFLPEVICNDDFPVSLEEKLFKAIENGSIKNADKTQLIAKKLVDNELYSKAIIYYQMIKGDLNNPGAWDKWAHCYAAQDDFSAAVSIVQEGLSQCPDSQLLSCNYAFYLSRDKQQSKALEVLDAFIQQIETKKYAGDRFYIYALGLKTRLYREYSMALHELIGYSRITTAGSWDREQVMNGVEEITPQVEGLNYG